MEKRWFLALLVVSPTLQAQTKVSTIPNPPALVTPGRETLDLGVEIPTDIDDLTFVVSGEIGGKKVTDQGAGVVMFDGLSPPVVIGHLPVGSKLSKFPFMKNYMGRMWYQIPMDQVQFTEQFTNSPGAIDKVQRGTTEIWVLGSYLKLDSSAKGES